MWVLTVTTSVPSRICRNPTRPAAKALRRSLRVAGAKTTGVGAGAGVGAGVGTGAGLAAAGGAECCPDPTRFGTSKTRPTAAATTAPPPSHSTRRQPSCPSRTSEPRGRRSPF